MREIKGHRETHKKSFEGSLCGAWPYRVTEDVAAVTCKRCIFLLVRSNLIQLDDPRVTDSMRKHPGFPKVSRPAIELGPKEPL